MAGGQGQNRNFDLPLFRGSITLKALTWKSSKSLAHAHPRWPPAILRTLTRITSVPECAVSSVGFLWGIGRRVAELLGFCGLAEAPDWPGQPGTGVPKSRRLPDPDDHFPGDPVSLERPARLS